MPHRPNTPCRHPGCAALVPYGQKYCEAHKPLHPEDVRSAAGRGYGRAWQMQIAIGNGHLCHVQRPANDMISGQPGTYYAAKFL